jgi:hypothetical protein
LLLRKEYHEKNIKSRNISKKTAVIPATFSIIRQNSGKIWNLLYISKILRNLKQHLLVLVVS